MNYTDQLGLGALGGSPVDVGFLAWHEGGKPFLPSSQGVSPRVPLWNNPNLPELYGHPDSIWWSRYDNTHFSHITNNNLFVSFEALKRSYSVDNKLIFKYLLFCHAIQTQFGTLTLELTESPL